MSYMSNRSIHDNNIYGYTVDCGQQQIVLHTEFHDAGRQEYTDVIFFRSIAHNFECVLQGNIIFGIEKVEPERIIEEWREVFARQKQYGWPDIEYDDLSELPTILRERDVTGYEISSSYGMRGWVLARTMEICERASKKVFV